MEEIHYSGKRGSLQFTLRPKHDEETRIHNLYGMKINWIVIALMVILIPLWPLSFIWLILCLRFKSVTAWTIFYRSTNNPSFMKIVGQRGIIDIVRVTKVNGIRTFVYRYTRWELRASDNVWVPSEFNC